MFTSPSRFKVLSNGQVSSIEYREKFDQWKLQPENPDHSTDKSVRKKLINFIDEYTDNILKLTGCERERKKREQKQPS